MIKGITCKGLTFIELIIVIIIGAVILVPLGAVVVQSVNKAFLPEHYTVSSGLLEGELERVSNLRFANVAAESGSFTGDFSNYSYDVSFYYVTGSDLITPSPTVTAYKRALVTISRSGFPSLSAVTLITDN